MTYYFAYNHDLDKCLLRLCDSLKRGLIKFLLFLCKQGNRFPFLFSLGFLWDFRKKKNPTFHVTKEFDRVTLHSVMNEACSFLFHTFSEFPVDNTVRHIARGPPSRDLCKMGGRKTVDRWKTSCAEVVHPCDAPNHGFQIRKWQRCAWWEAGFAHHSHACKCRVPIHFN